jgi:hypothetical protein
MIAPEAGLSVSRQCALLGIARRFITGLGMASAEELDLLKRLDRIFTGHPVYGSRRRQALLPEGISVGRRRVQPASGPRRSSPETITIAAIARRSHRTQKGSERGGAPGESPSPSCGRGGSIVAA